MVPEVSVKDRADEQETMLCSKSLRSGAVCYNGSIQFVMTAAGSADIYKVCEVLHHIEADSLACCTCVGVGRRRGVS